MVDIVKNVRIDGDKVSGNAKVSGLDKYTDVTINGQKITSDGSYNYTPNTVISSTSAKTNTSTVVESKPAVESEQKKVVETKKDTRSFWQRHTWLRVLLTIFLCLLLIGLLMIAAYHIMHAVNSSKKNDKIDDAKKADEEIKNNKDNMSEENQKKLEEGTLTKDDVKGETTRQENDQKLANDTKDYIDKYGKETDATKKTEISNQYASSQEEALKSGKLNSTSLKETLKNEQSELDVANGAVDEAAKSAQAAGISDADITSIKGDSEATISTAYSDDQEVSLESLRESVRKQTQEQADVTYVQNKLTDVQAYEKATTDTAKTTALNTFKTNETNRFTTDPAISSEDASKWISQETSELKSAQSFAKSFDTISDISKDNGFTYKAGTTTTDEMTKAIESNYNNKFPESHGWFRKLADSLALAGGVGALGTGLAGLIGNSVTKDDGKKVVTENREVDVVNNNPAEKNTKTVTETTEIVRS